ncbi:MAG TPA: hypothetical protein EYH56_00420 [Nanoarchaeota archaeon]|nr:hypothetical protein [Nanoarchaeota archaeon]
MKKYECILLRVSGELSLKSEQVKPKFFSLLVRNVRKSLDRKNIEHRIEVNPSRIFVYTNEISQAVKSLIKVFGISSLSPCWTCASKIDEISLLASDIAVENLKLDNTKSFALRVRKAGRHKEFSLKTLADEVGGAVKRVTNAKVDLTNPDIEIFIECRSRRTYIFVKKIKAVGGLPLGSGGKACALVYSYADLVAAWLVMRRGNSLVVFTDNEEYENILRSWHIGERISINYEDKEKALKEALKLQLPIVKGSLFSQLHSTNAFVLNPIICFPEKIIKKMYEKIKKFSKL